MATMRDMVGTDLRPAEMYAAIARETAWQPGGFAKLKNHAATQILELLDGEWSPASQAAFETCDRWIAGVEEYEALGWTEADVERFVDTGLTP